VVALASLSACDAIAAVRAPIIAAPPTPSLAAATPSPSPTNTVTASPSPTPTDLPTPSPLPTVPPPTATPPPQIEIVAVGDVMLGRMVNKTSIAQGDFGWPFQFTRDILAAADLTIGNLESPLIPYCEQKGLGLRFCGDTRAAEGLRDAGFDAMGLANNHASDYGVEGRRATLAALEAGQIAGVRDGSPAVYEVNGIRIGILAYYDVDRNLDIDRAAAETSAMAGQVDVVIGLLHWGYEYQPQPSERQQKLAHALIDAGMRVIIGSHPHWLQPIETCKNSVIFYSLGNFVFDQTWSRQTRESVMARLTITRHADSLDIAYDLIPIEIIGYGQPQLATTVTIPTPVGEIEQPPTC